MQNLEFEASWDKSLAGKDRKEIEEIFHKTCNTESQKVSLTPIWQAVNHKSELLITVLVHNFTEKELTFQNKRLAYMEKEKICAIHTFTLQTLIIKPKVSMPWTFIFPAESLKNHATFQNGHLVIVNI
ncbi:SLAP domain-containing protein [Psychrobacillus sp. FJAT-51614]|uniref:SLAP domain-containing protein n=1 Tax=Psychrobacillus mangrovi TaxID=3117745 RepID=A0ABU8F9A7_9BACI